MNGITEGMHVGLFKDGSIKTGIIKKLLDGRSCLFVQDYTNDEHRVDVKKIRVIHHSIWGSGV